MTPDFFAYNQYRDHVMYKALAETESSPEFKEILEKLVEQEYDDYIFWRQFATQKTFHVRSHEIRLFKLIRKIFGLTFTAKLLEGHEKEMQGHYGDYLNTLTDESLKEKMKEMIVQEKEHERYLLSQVKEDKVHFMSNIVLGLNDGLIELTGALVGFSLALQKTPLIALSGIITGISASLSMAASAYMQAHYEEGRDAKKAGFYTGGSYLIVMGILVAPFLLLQSIVPALCIMLVLTLAIILVISWYTTVLFERPFRRQFTQMFLFSLGIAAVAFGIGLLSRVIVGVRF